MNLDDYCAEHWKTDRQNDDADALFDAVKQYQANRLSAEKTQELIQYVLCNNGKIRKIWNLAKKIIFKETVSFYSREKDQAPALRQLNACCSEVIKMKVKACLSSFDLNRLQNQSHADTLNLISAYITKSVHYQKVIEELGIEYIHHCQKKSSCSSPDCPQEHISEVSPESLVIQKDIFEKIILKENGFQKAQAHLTLTDFINECRTGQTKSARARQQKKRLKKFFTDTWELDDLSAVNIVENIEYLLYNHQI